MSGKLSTHVLDTARGRPAAAIAVELWSIDPATHRLMLQVRATTDDDGRAVLLADEMLRSGLYELVFVLGGYFAEFYEPGGLPFFDRVPVRFAIANPDARYHIPLLISPWSYSTYRGS